MADAFAKISIYILITAMAIRHNGMVYAKFANIQISGRVSTPMLM